MAAPDTQLKTVSGLQTVTNVADAREMADSLVRGAITSLRKPLETPTSEGVDLTGLNDEIDRASNTRDQTNVDIDRERGRYSEANLKQRDAIKAEGKATAEKVLADQDQVQQEADNQAYFAKLFGISVDPSAQIAENVKQLTVLNPQAQEKLRKVQEMQKVGPLDNPMRWFINQLQLPGAISDYNNDATMINNLEDSINKGIKLGQDAANFAGRGIPKITVQQAAAGSQMAIAAADKNAAIAEENYAKQDITFAVQKLANDLNVANATQQMTSEQLRNERLKYESQINAVNLAENHATRMLKAAQLLETLEKTKGLDIILENYDRIMGHPKGTTTRYTFEKFAEPQRQNMVAIGAGSVGSDPLTGMLNWFNSRPGPEASVETSRFMNFLREKADAIATTQDVQMMDEKQKPQAIAIRLRKELDTEFQGATKLGSIFYELEPATMLRSGKIAPNSALAKILEPLSKTSGPVQTSIILDSIIANVPNPTDAGTLIAQYYRANIDLRNASMNTSITGVKMPTNYTLAEGSFLSGGRMKLDLTKPEEATKLVLYRNVLKQINLSGAAFGSPYQPIRP